MFPKGTVRDVLKREVVTIDASKSLIEAARLMVEKKVAGKGIGSVVVTRREKVVGIVTERGFLEKVALQGLDVRKIRVGNYVKPCGVLHP